MNKELRGQGSLGASSAVKTGSLLSRGAPYGDAGVGGGHCGVCVCGSVFAVKEAGLCAESQQMGDRVAAFGNGKDLSYRQASYPTASL